MASALSEIRSRRRKLMEGLVAIWGKVPTGKYFVTRNAVNWSRFDFETNPYGVSILCEHTPLLTDGTPIIVGFEVYTSMRDREFDDGITDKFFDDATWVLDQLFVYRDPQDGTLISSGIDPSKALAFESSDVIDKVQGLIVQCPIFLAVN